MDQAGMGSAWQVSAGRGQAFQGKAVLGKAFFFRRGYNGRDDGG